ncbi:MAG: metal ABC transporter ATP-binding protein [Clostridia bacterium]|nr:metal ABC transporter ATP-binding protein [Clostridia bacterium]
MAQIICKDLSLGYDGVAVCEGLNFSIEKGDYLCIVGENGSGKTTLMKALLSLKAPLSGKIEFGDGVSDRDVGYLPQQSELRKDFPASVREVVTSGCTSRLGKRFFMGKAERLEAEQNMKMMRVYDLADKSYSTLSGGQMQRVLLARALCAANKILVLDEPVSGLDPAATADMYSTIHHLNKHTGITIIMVTHDIENALRDATAVLKIGKTPIYYSSAEEYRGSLDGGAV